MCRNLIQHNFQNFDVVRSRHACQLQDVVHVRLNLRWGQHFVWDSISTAQHIYIYISETRYIYIYIYIFICRKYWRMVHYFEITGYWIPHGTVPSWPSPAVCNSAMSDASRYVYTPFFPRHVCSTPMPWFNRPDQIALNTIIPKHNYMNTYY